MAIFHFSAQVIGRKAGRSAVAAAAYRSGSRLRDERIDRDHDFSNKSGVVHSEVMLPEHAPQEWADREKLWNKVEAVEVRKDAQLAREIEFAIPREMSHDQGIALARDFVQAEFVDHGMVADLNVHWDVGADGMPKPHAHVMLTMREVSIGEDGEARFGAKQRDWNRTELVERWRKRWADHVNERLAELDIDARIDHRSLEAQGIALEPQHKIGAPARRMEADGLEADRVEEHREIARENGERIIRNPNVALDAITQQQATFTNRDLAMFAHRHSDGIEQFNEVMSAVRSSPDMIELGRDGRGEERFTSREMIEAEQRLQRAADLMAERERHRVEDTGRDRALERATERGLSLSGEQQDAFRHVTEGKDLSVVVGYAGTGKSAMLGVARQAWEDAGHSVRGVALSGIAAEGLENGSGIASRTIASMEHQWGQGRELLTARDVLVIDEAGMVGTRQMERIMSHAAEMGAKVVLVGDVKQLQSIEAGAAFRSIHERHGGVEITQVRRQHEDWQRDATRDLANGKTGNALAAYRDHGMVHEAGTRDEARGELIDRWDRERQASPDASRIILTHTNDEVRELNLAARDRMREAGDLGEDVRVTVERGARDFSPGDRIMFLKNERSLEVKNGTLGTVERVSDQAMTVRTDDGRSVAFDLKDYNAVDHGYAATVHKAQGMTVDRTHVLATPGMDRHGAYVALSRHREGMDLHYGRDDFTDRDKLVRALSRDRSKDMASDYEPARDYAGRRGVSFRERVEKTAEIAKPTPDRTRGMFDGLRLSLPKQSEARQEPQRAPERERAAGKPERQNPFASFRPDRSVPAREVPASPDQARDLAVQRHARAVARIFDMQDKNLPTLPHQTTELAKAREVLKSLGDHAAKDMESAYSKDPSLATEAAAGRTGRAIRALQQETELRTDVARRADKFVENWNGLKNQSRKQYEIGDMTGHKATRSTMAELAKGLERDPQLESILAGRKQQLGIGMESGRSLGRALAFTHGLDLGLGRGLGL